MQDRQALQAQIKAVRDRHAALFKEQRADQQAVRQIAAPKIAKAFTQESRPAPSVEDRIERQRSDERSPRTGRSRDIDRER
jgi:hypothetical protein